jgi:hypothetical protein
MIVSELIALLAECDPEWDVYLDGDSEVPVTTVTAEPDDGYVDIS